MNIIKKASYAIASAVFAIGIVGGGVAFADPPPFVWVDNSSGCSETGGGTVIKPYCKIQTAVNKAQTGATIYVDSGTYNETVTVSKTVILKGDPGTLVTGAAGAFKLTADKAVVDGFTMQNASGPAVTTSSSKSGYVISDNIIRNNTYGMNLASSGTYPTVIEENSFETNNKTGTNTGNGIYSNQTLKNVKISENKFSGHVNTSITLASGVTRSAITISQNESVQEKTFANIYATSGLLVDRNNLHDFVPGGNAIFLAGGSNGAVIDRNIIVGAAGSGVRVQGSSSSVTIKRNDIRNSGQYGISLAQSAVNGGGIDTNTVNNSLIDGINIASGNKGILVQDNTATDNIAFDIRDSSVGSGFKNTANQYDDNTCVKDSPDGLCEFAPVPPAPVTP